TTSRKSALKGQYGLACAFEQQVTVLRVRVTQTLFARWKAAGSPVQVKMPRGSFWRNTCDALRASTPSVRVFPHSASPPHVAHGRGKEHRGTLPVLPWPVLTWSPDRRSENAKHADEPRAGRSVAPSCQAPGTDRQYARHSVNLCRGHLRDRRPAASFLR